MRSLNLLLLVACFFISVYCQFGTNKYYRQQQNNYASQLSPLSGSCPEPNGTFPTSTCDGYIECKNGIPEDKVCPDGLLFNPASGPQAFPCQYPIDVDCAGREKTQPAQATDDCPHQFGYYKLGDERNCGQFKNCVDGRGFVFDCPEGLAFSEDNYRCDWPDQVTSCDAEAYLGFTCPSDARAYGLGQEEFRFFRSPNDCQRYFVCVENRPRMYNCGDGKAFNDLTNSCDGAENVTGCAIPQYQNEFKGAPTKLAKFSNANAYKKFNGRF